MTGPLVEGHIYKTDGFQSSELIETQTFATDDIADLLTYQYL